MRIDDLTLYHYRNYASEQVEFSPEINVFLGDNAQGKTNALEAIYLMAIGKSHRTAKDRDLIQWGEESASVAAHIARAKQQHKLRLEFSTNGKKALIAGIPQAKMTDFVGHFQVVLFAPEDLQLVKGGPPLRRRFIDTELGQTHRSYLYHLTHYQRVLQQRNAILKQTGTDTAYLEVFDEQLVQHGSQVLSRRLEFVRRLSSLAVEIHRGIADGRESLAIGYETSIPKLRDELRRGTLEGDAEIPALEKIEEWFRFALSTKRTADLQLGYTSVGPHRDDLSCSIDGKSAQSFASQGQQRTIALSLRLAEIELIRADTGEYPVLLLDDVLSELDDVRQRNLIFSMQDRVQTIVTSTNLFQVADRLQGEMRLFHVHSGIIRVEG